MINFLKKHINSLLAPILLVYYLLLAWVIHRTGYEHSENVFIAEKLKVLIENPESTLHVLGTTYPSLVFLSSLMFAPFGYLYAPVLASITLTTILFYVLLNDFKASKQLPAYLYIPVLVMLFVFHPGLMYAAVSGRGVAAVLLCFYLLFRCLFKYYKTQSTFYLSTASICLCCLVFCNYNFIWLLLAFFPFVVLVSLSGLKIDKGLATVLQYYEAINNRSQRRKLVNRTVAIYVVLFLMPFATLSLFKILNKFHAGDATYFLTSQYANWHVVGDIPIGTIISKGWANDVVEQSQIVFQFYLLAFNPLLILTFLFYRGRAYELFTFLAPFLLITVLLINIRTYFTIEYYLIFLLLGLIGISTELKRKVNIKVMWFIVFIVTLLNIGTGLYYFKQTKDREELAFFASLRNYKSWSKGKRTTEESKIAAYISSVCDKNNRVLIDDAAAFQVIAHMTSLDWAILSQNQNFLTVVENPAIAAKYICIAKDNNDLKNFTVLNEYNLQRMITRGRLSMQLAFQSEHWAVYRIE
ncbi:hypothetical protein ACI6Q2_07450 [Chitinophagaceae bacterium LWZ2-11]